MNKPTITIEIKGFCSTPRMEMAEKIQKFMTGMGFGEVEIDGPKTEKDIHDDLCAYDGFLSEEKVIIKVMKPFKS